MIRRVFDYVALVGPMIRETPRLTRTTRPNRRAHSRATPKPKSKPALRYGFLSTQYEVPFALTFGFVASPGGISRTMSVPYGVPVL